MKTLADLTPEIRAKIGAYKERCTKDLYSGVEYMNYKRHEVVEYIEKIYDIVHKDKPVVIVAKDPIDYARKFRLLQNERVLDSIYKIFEDKKANPNAPDIDDETMFKDFEGMTVDKSIEVKSHYLYLASTYHRVYLMWYKFIQDEFHIDHKNVELLNWLYDHANNNISRCYFTQMYVLVLRMPKYIRRNNIGFHNLDGAAIEWENYGMYYVNGRKLTKELFESLVNKTYTFEQFMAETNEDIKATVITLISEKFGNAELMKFLNASVADEQTITHTSGHVETMRLWKTNEKFSFLSDINGNGNQPYAWLEIKCPSTDSIFFISTSPHFTDVIDCAKFHRPNTIPFELEYDFQEFNN